MFGPGEYVPDPTEGIVDVKDLPAPIRAIQFSERGCKSSLKRVKGFCTTWGFA